MDRALTAQKLESLRRCLARIDAKRPATAAELAADADLQDIIALNLTRAVQLSVDIAAHLIADRADLPPPATMGQAFETLQRAGIIDASLCARLQRAVGFRNLAVHSYERIDWAMVHTITGHHLQDFTEFARCVWEHAQPQPET